MSNSAVAVGRVGAVVGPGEEALALVLGIEQRLVVRTIPQQRVRGVPASTRRRRSRSPAAGLGARHAEVDAVDDRGVRELVRHADGVADEVAPDRATDPIDQAGLLIVRRRNLLARAARPASAFSSSQSIDAIVGLATCQLGCPRSRPPRVRSSPGRTPSSCPRSRGGCAPAGAASEAVWSSVGSSPWSTRFSNSPDRLAHVACDGVIGNGICDQLEIHLELSLLGSFALVRPPPPPLGDAEAVCVAGLEPLDAVGIGRQCGPHLPEIVLAPGHDPAVVALSATTTFVTASLSGRTGPPSTANRSSTISW